jgi:hypothetical protein
MSRGEVNDVGQGNNFYFFPLAHGGCQQVRLNP